MRTPRLSRQTLLVLQSCVQRPTDWHYGYQLSRETGLKSGTLYPILMRLEACKLLEARWVATQEGVPPRHTYRLTPTGLELARTQLDAPRARWAVRQPALSKG